MGVIYGMNFCVKNTGLKIIFFSLLKIYLKFI